MNSRNMALMFAPNIFRRRKGNEGEVSLAHITALVKPLMEMLDAYSEIFETDADLESDSDDDDDE